MEIEKEKKAYYIDHSLFPDVAMPPVELHTPEEKADYLHRVCAAWDAKLHPEPETFELLRTWQDIFDHFPLPYSPAYHAFREWFGWPLGPAPDSSLPLSRLTYEDRDYREGREKDPCEGMV